MLHVSINTSAPGALDATRAFYADLFALPTAPRPPIPGIDGHWFTVADAQLHLVGAPAEGGDGPDPTGPHCCLGVDDLDAAVAELDERGIAWRDAWQGPVRQVWIRDPSGATIELQEDHRKA